MGVMLEIGLFIAIIILASAVARRILGHEGSPRRRRSQDRLRNAIADAIESSASERAGARSGGKESAAGGGGPSAELLELAKLKLSERKENREAYERLITEKLDVLKQAVAMGYSDQDLERLDARLEKLIGKEKLGQLLNEEGEIPQADDDLLDRDLDREIERLKQTQADG